MSYRITQRDLATLALVAFSVACGGDGASPVAAALTLASVAGDAQTAVAGSAVSTRPSVRLTRGSTPVAGRAVTFAVASGGGSVTGATQTTDASGTATVGSWTLGTGAGTNTVTASAGGDVTGSPVTFSASGTAGPPANLARGTGDGQTAAAGQSVATRPTVRVTDANGNGVSGVGVTFMVAAGDGIVTGAQQTTDATGTATVGGWTLGTRTGVNRLVATTTGPGIAGSPATFTATGVAGPPARIVKSAGDGQRAPVATALPVRPSVQVTDEHGNGVSGIAVTFAVASGGGTAAGVTQTTDANGTATVGGWTLGTSLGIHTLSATLSASGAANPVVFAATATAGPPAALAKQNGDGQTAVAGSAIATRPTVRVTDAAGNPVEGTAVTFAIGSGGGTLSGASATTDASGVATVGAWTLGTLAGANTLTATVAGSGILGNPATFTATGIAGPAATIAKVAGDAQGAIASTEVAVPPAVRLTDVNGNAVAGVAVDFVVTLGGGTVTGGTQTTNATGVATVGGWTLGATSGPNALRATAAGSGLAGNPATFTATAGLNPTALAGNWTGGWNNLTFGSSGSATMTMAVNTTTRAVTLVLDLNGNVFGLPDPPAETLTGTYPVAGGFTVSGPSALFGALTLVVSPGGAVQGTGLNPRPGIARVDFTGTAGPNTIALTYTIAFTGGGTANGTLNLTKP